MEELLKWLFEDVTHINWDIPNYLFASGIGAAIPWTFVGLRKLFYKPLSSYPIREEALSIIEALNKPEKWIVFTDHFSICNPKPHPLSVYDDGQIYIVSEFITSRFNKLERKEIKSAVKKLRVTVEAKEKVKKNNSIEEVFKSLKSN